MTIRHLKVFITVCKFSSISKAAEYLHVAQPSISQSIKELESYYNVRLFDRCNRKLSLTKEGSILLIEAQDVIDEFEEFEAFAKKEDLNPIIRIGATMTFGAFIIPRFLDTIKKELPKADPRFYIDKPAGLEDKILKGELDFAFEEGLINSKQLKSIEIGEDSLIAVVSNNYKIPNKISIKDLVKYDLLLREQGNPSRRILDYQLALKGIKLGIPRVESVSNNAILSMVLSGNGIGILPEAIVRSYINDNKIRKIELDVELKRKLFIICHKQKKFNEIGKRVYKAGIEILKISQLKINKTKNNYSGFL